MSWSDFYFFLRDFCISSTRIPRFFTVLVCGIYLFPYHAGHYVSDIETLMTLWNTNRIQVGGLLFSGLLISCPGAVMDVAMSISSAIDEIYKQNSALTRKELFKAGMRVGRDMMGTDSNTLILAFAGSFGIVLSVPLTVLICTILFHRNKNSLHN